MIGLQISRRSTLFGLASVAAPAVIRTAGLLMPVRSVARVVPDLATGDIWFDWTRNLHYVWTGKSWHCYGEQFLLGKTEPLRPLFDKHR